MAILYHYPMSPYSEKLRAAMGFAGIRWQSAVVPEQPPRALLNGLIGGYRRIPVLQMGAQFYCDTRLAFEALDVGDSSASHLDPGDEAFREWAESEIFFAVFSACSSLQVLRFLHSQVGLADAIRFVRDRMGMMKNATITPLGRKSAAIQIHRYVADLELRLASGCFLAGDSPGYLDFCCYHPLWMICHLDKAASSRWPHLVTEWVARMRALSNNEVATASPEAILEGISGDDTKPLETVEAPFRRGGRVSVAPSDYARDETIGELVVLNRERIVLSRGLDSGQLIYVHFPREGFDLVQC